MGTKKQDEGTITNQVQVSASALRRLLRPREGFLAFVEPMLTLYDAQIDELRIQGVSTDAVRAELRLYQQLLTRESALEQELAIASEARAVHGANIWRTVLDIYARAQSAARNNTVVRHAIGALATFLKRGHKKEASPTQAVTKTS